MPQGLYPHPFYDTFLPSDRRDVFLEVLSAASAHKSIEEQLLSRSGPAPGALSADKVEYDPGHSDELKHLTACRIPLSIDKLIATHNEVCDVAEGLKDRYIMSKEQKDQRLLYKNLAKDAILQSLKKVTNNIADLASGFDEVFDEQLSRVDALSSQMETIHSKITMAKEAANVAAMSSYKLANKQEGESVSSSGGTFKNDSSSIASALAAVHESISPRKVRFGSEQGRDASMVEGVMERSAEGPPLPAQEDVYARVVRRGVEQRLEAFRSRYGAGVLGAELD